MKIHAFGKQNNIYLRGKKNYRTTGYNGLLGLITNMLKIGFKTRFIQKKVQIQNP